MAKVLTRPVKVRKEGDKESTWLQPGDEVPRWAEDIVPVDCCDDAVVVAGTVNLVTDQVYQVVKAYADEHGVEYGDDWSADQIAAAVRLDEHNEQSPGVDDDSAEKAKSAMAALFDDSNKSGNVAAPNREVKASKASKPDSGARGGTDS